MVVEQGHPMNRRLEEEGMNTVKEYYHPTNHRLKVEDIDMDMVRIHIVEVEVWIRWRSITIKWITDRRWRVWIGRIVMWGRIWRMRWRWLKESTMVWCWWDIGPAMERRGIDEIVGSGRNLWNWDV
jgi:hypothetical protein